MGRPSTKPKKLKDGYYIEVRNKGAKTGIKLHRDTEEDMLYTVKEYEKTKDVIVHGLSVNGKFASDIKKSKRKKKAPKAAKK